MQVRSSEPSISTARNDPIQKIPTAEPQSEPEKKIRRRFRQKLAPPSRAYAPSYSDLASLMNANPEKAILRKFGDLNMKNLLYLQAELIELQDELGEISKGDDPLFDRDWFCLAHAEDNRQWTIMTEIRDVLKEYNDALTQQSFNFGFDRPHSYDLKVLRKLLVRPKMGNQFLLGLDSKAWNEDTEEDLICLSHQGDEDHLSKWVTDKFMVWIHYLFGRRLNQNTLVYYSEDRALRLLSLISTVLASILPIVAIVVLYVVPTTKYRLGILAGSTAVFALILSVVAKAKRSDGFAATAAFAAVQVVFIDISGPT
ncbi:hypothetical protein MMC18_001897 [Xylographa bjoerkii]|nr:hypothetical protein [Xylographa bjoerkii]